MMFRQYYGMSYNPYEKELETKNAYMTQDMKSMQGRLEHLKQHPGIGLFTAGSGQGKTFSLRYFSESLNPNITKFYYICLSTVTTTEFYRQMCTTLGLESACHKASMFRNIQNYFEMMSMNKKIHFMVCLDEAQYLNNDTQTSHIDFSYAP